VYLRRLSRTHHPPQCVVQLSRFGQLSVSADGRVESAEVRQCGGKGQAVQHLREEEEGKGEEVEGEEEEK